MAKLRIAFTIVNRFRNYKNITFQYIHLKTISGIIEIGEGIGPAIADIGSDHV